MLRFDRLLAAGALVLGACAFEVIEAPTGDAPSADAIGSMIDATASDAPSRSCDPDPGFAVIANEGVGDGGWRLTWSCVGGCALHRPALTYSSRVTINVATLAYTDDDCPECRAVHLGRRDATGCVEIAAGVDFESQCRFGYAACVVGDGLVATVTWKEPGSSARTWRLTGAR